MFASTTLFFTLYSKGHLPYQQQEGEEARDVLKLAISEHLGLLSYVFSQLLHAVVAFVVVNHTSANHLHRLEFLEHDWFAALSADTAGHMVNLFAVCQRGTCRL